MVTLLIVSIVYFLQKDDIRDEAPVAVANLATPDSALALRITSLEHEIERLHSRLKYHGADPDDQERSVRFDERIAQIELTLDKLSSKAQESHTGSHATTPERMSDRMDQTSEVITDQKRAYMEAQFDNDSGLPLGDFSHSIEDVMHQVDGIQAQGIDCRNTICKVTYAPAGPALSGSDDVDWQIMEQLLERSGGRQVDIKYVSDALGNNAMYIQLN